MTNTRRSRLALQWLRAPAWRYAALPGRRPPGWEPTKTVEFIVPAGTGGGADQMARMIQGVVQKHNLMDQPIVVINKSGGAGAEGFLDVKARRGQPAQDHHHAVEPVHHAARDRRAVQLGGPDPGRDAGARRVHPVGQRRRAATRPRRNTSTRRRRPARAASRWAARARSRRTRSSPSRCKKASGAEFTYVPFKGGGDVAVQLVGGHINSTVNNPIEQVAHWRAGDTRPLCVFDSERLAYTDKMTDTMAWSDIPTCKESGIDVEYLMLRGIFMPAGVEQEQVDFYVDLFSEGARDARVAGLHEQGRLQHHLHDRRRVQGVGGGGGRSPPEPDGGSGLPRRVSELWAPGSALARSRSRIAPAPGGRGGQLPL